MEGVPQRSGHSTKPDRAEGAFGQCFQAQGVTLGDVQGQELDLLMLVGSF